MTEYGFSDSLAIECFMSAFEAKYAPDFNFIGEYHDFWEVVYIISSKAGISADEKIYSLSQGDIVFHKPMEFHRIWAIEGKPVHAFIFSFRLGGDLSEKLKNMVIKLSAERIDAVMRLMEEFRAQEKENAGDDSASRDFMAHWKKDAPMNTALKCRAELLLFDIIKNEIDRKEQYSSRSADIYRRIIQIMKENIYANLSVADIAKKCSFSEAYIKKIFSEFSDCGIHTYFTKLKIKEAIALMEGGMTVGEVSEKLSFANANYFAVCFRREMGCSPTKYIKTR